MGANLVIYLLQKTIIVNDVFKEKKSFKQQSVQRILTKLYGKLDLEILKQVF